MILAEEKQCMRRKTCQNVSFFQPHILHWAGVGSNPSLCVERLAANSTCMYGTLFVVRE